MSRKSTFAADVKRFADKTIREQERIMRAVALEIDKEVVMKTPVDTGRARANWVIEINSVPSSFVEKSANANPIADATGAVMRARIGDIIYIVNGLPYIRVLEYGEYPNPPKKGSRIGRGSRAKYVIKSQGGYSRQAPQGMVRITAQRWNQFIKEVANGNG